MYIYYLQQKTQNLSYSCEVYVKVHDTEKLKSNWCNIQQVHIKSNTELIMIYEKNLNQ